jgi:hypothetical protein
MLNETIRFVICATLAVLVLFGTAALLTGCADLKYAECVTRDRTSNPCN